MLTFTIYNQPEVTEAIKTVLGDDYNYDSTVGLKPSCFCLLRNFRQNTFRALYRTFTQCCFIEDDGDIVFYKNKLGGAARVLSPDALNSIPN